MSHTRAKHLAHDAVSECFVTKLNTSCHTRVQSMDATIRYYRNRRTNYGAEIDGQHLPENRDWQTED